MADISHDKLQRSDFLNNVSANDKTEDINLYQLRRHKEKR